MRLCVSLWGAFCLPYVQLSIFNYLYSTIYSWSSNLELSSGEWNSLRSDSLPDWDELNSAEQIWTGLNSDLNSGKLNSKAFNAKDTRRMTLFGLHFGKGWEGHQSCLVLADVVLGVLVCGLGQVAQCAWRVMIHQLIIHITYELWIVNSPFSRRFSRSFQLSFLHLAPLALSFSFFFWLLPLASSFGSFI